MGQIALYGGIGELNNESRFPCTKYSITVPLFSNIILKLKEIKSVRKKVNPRTNILKWKIIEWIKNIKKNKWGPGITIGHHKSHDYTQIKGNE